MHSVRVLSQLLVSVFFIAVPPITENSKIFLVLVVSLNCEGVCDDIVSCSG